MTTGIHDHGKEYLQRLGMNDLSPISSIDIGLYDDSTDSLAETDDLAAISTEPTGSNYSRQTVSVPSGLTFGQDDSNDIYYDVDDQTFDTSDSTQSVDSYFIVINFQATVVTSDGSATDHLLLTGGLGESVNLSNWAQFTARDIKGTLQRV